jgi:hypothetical protein
MSKRSAAKASFSTKAREAAARGRKAIWHEADLSTASINVCFSGKVEVGTRP